MTLCVESVECLTRQHVLVQNTREMTARLSGEAAVTRIISFVSTNGWNLNKTFAKNVHCVAPPGPINEKRPIFNAFLANIILVFFTPLIWLWMLGVDKGVRLLGTLNKLGQTCVNSSSSIHKKATPINMHTPLSSVFSNIKAFFLLSILS